MFFEKLFLLNVSENKEEISMKYPLTTTTLSEQIDNMNQAIAVKMHNYKPKTDTSAVNAITKILKKHSRAPISALEEQKIRNSISLAIDNGIRIPMGFTWGCSGMALSTMKLRERVNYPRKGDLWGFWWFDILNKKIKCYYEPGINLIIGDEVPHFHALGWKYEDIVRRHEIMKNLIEQHFDFIRVIAIPDYAVIIDDIDINIAASLMDEILAIATSLPYNSIPREVFDSLYSKRKTKNWSWIREQIPLEIWKEARRIIAKANKIGRLRKEFKFFDNLFGTSEYIDATFTEKGRFCPKPWSNTLPQHGTSVLTAPKGTGKYSVAIVPEYRMENQQPEYAPVMINALEFKKFTRYPVEDILYTFYWVSV